MEPLRVDVWADVACPWCWIGHARLQRALLEEEPDSVVIVPRAFELRPDLPAEGVAAEAFAIERFGGPDRAREAFARVAAEGASEGLPFRFDLMRVVPNTRLAHRLVVIAGRQGRGLTALGALFEATFRRGVDITGADAAVAAVARATHLDAAELRAALDAGEGAQEVVADEELAARIGITAVPFFLAAGRFAVTGAQEPKVLRELLAAAREPRAAA